MARLGASFPGGMGMSVTRNTVITQAAVDTLATLANGIGAPMPTNFEFSNFDDTVLPPTAVVGTINYGSGSYVAEGTTIIVHVYSYKDVSGVLHYSPRYAIGHVTPNNSTDAYEIEWNWTPPVAAVDGYIYVLFATFTSTVGEWADVTALPFTDDGAGLTQPLIGTRSTWNPVEGWAARENYLGNSAGVQIPGPWLRELGRIRQNIVSFTPDATWLVSGPWCVSVGPRLRYGSDDLVYGSVEFWYAADDHAGNVDIDTVAEIGAAVLPFEFTNALSGDVFQDTMVFSLPAAHSMVGQIVWTCANAVAGGSTQALSVIAGAVTITTETWTISDDTITLDFELSLPTGASQVRIDIDLNDGTNSFSNDGLMNADVVLATENLAASAVDIIHPTSTGSKVTPTAIDASLGPVVFQGVNYYPSFHVVGDIDGVWVATTRFAYGIHTYLESDLPNYYLNSTTSGPRGEADDDPQTFAITPAVRARSSLWPVFRDTDFGTWRRMTPGTTETEVPYYPQDTFHAMLQHTASAEAGGVTGYFSVLVGSNYEQLVLRASNLAMTIYVSTSGAAIDPALPASYDVSGVGEVRLPDDFSYAGGGTVWYLAKNTTATAASFYLRRILCSKTAGGVYPGDTPDFFKKLVDGNFGYEKYSYNTANSTIGGSNLICGHLEIPHSGYCVFEVVVSRLPVLGTDGLWAVPSTGQAALDVKLGVMLDQTFDVAGTFEEFQTVTILANEPSVTTTVFWPVIKGTPLAYQATSTVDVMAYVNFMPAVNSHFFPDYDYSSGGVIGQSVHGQWSGERQATAATQLGPDGAWMNGRGDSLYSDQVVMPVSATFYNDTEATLNLL